MVVDDVVISEKCVIDAVAASGTWLGYTAHPRDAFDL